MFLYIIKSIFRDKKRLISNVITIGISFMFILVINGFIAGVYHQAASYFANTNSDLYVGKSATGIIGNNSTISSSVSKQLQDIEGIDSVSEILTVPMVLKHNGNHPLILIGYDKNNASGGPWEIFKGREVRNRFDIVIDKAFAAQKNIKLGQNIYLFDKDFKVVGFSEGTSSFLNPLAFVSIKTTREVAKLHDGTTYFLIKTKSSNRTSNIIKSKIKDIKIKTPDDLANIDKTKLSNAMGPILNVMTAIAFLVSVMVVGLALMTTVLSRKKQIATLKAIGHGKLKIYLIILGQGIIYCFTGLAVGLFLAFLTAEVIENAFPKVLVLIDTSSIGNAFLTTLVVAIMASVIPAKKILGLDPATAF